MLILMMKLHVSACNGHRQVSTGSVSRT